MRNGLEITIPIYNEDRTLVPQVRLLMAYLETLNLEESFSIGLVLADNASTDQTLSHAELLSKEHKGIRVITVPQKGVGYALQESWATSDFEFIGYMDLDFSTDLKHLEEVTRQISNFDFVVGSRLLKKSYVQNRSIIREITSRSFNLLLRILFKTKITDAMCGFKFLKRESYLGIEDYVKNEGHWFFCAETIIRLESSGRKFIEIPIKWTDDRNSKVKIIRLALVYLQKSILLKMKMATCK